MSSRIIVFAAIVQACVVIMPSSANAGATDVFSKLDGSFKGSGTSLAGSDGKKRRVTCSLTNTYKKSTGKLTMRGKCASSQGSIGVKGSISHKGNAVTGTYISLRSSLKNTKSSGKVGKNSISIYSSFVDKKTSKLIKVRQVIQLTGSGFQTDFQAFDSKSKKYKPAGVISFKRK